MTGSTIETTTPEPEAELEAEPMAEPAKAAASKEEEEVEETASAEDNSADDGSAEKEKIPEIEGKIVPASPPTPTPSPGKKIAQAPASASGERTNIRKRLEVAVNSAPVTTNRSSELVPLTQQYEETRKNMRNLHAAAKAYQQGLRDLHSKRIEMMKHMSLISEETPLFDAVGKPKGEGEPVSLDARVRACAAESEMHSKHFDMSVIDYVSEWDRITSDRINAELKEAGKLKSTRSHYEDKVNKMREEVREKEEKGKSPKKSLAEKLERNEEKLRKAFIEHEEYCGRLCVLIEESSTKIGRWRDMLPVAKTYMQWESDRCAAESHLMGALGETIEMMETNAMDADAAAKKATVE